MPVCSPKLTKAPISAVDGINKYCIKEKHSFMLQVWREGERKRIQTLKKKEGEVEDEEVKI